MRRLRLFSMFAAAAAVTVVMAPAAVAGFHVPGPYYGVSQCSGSVVRHWSLHNEIDEPAGLVQLWYSSANGGTNCAMAYDEASGKHYIQVTLRRGDLSYAGSDSGTYEYYAGGVAVGNTNGRCMYVTANLVLGSYRVQHYTFSSGAVACG